MGVMDIVHGVLDVAGFIPVVGAVADVANAVIYAAEGDWGNAALSAVSAIPGVGDAVGAVGKGGKLLLKGAKLVEDALAKGKKMLSSFGKRMGKAKTGAKKITGRSRKKKVEETKTESKHVCTNGKCFTGDMLIFTKQGLRPVIEIRKGDDIYSRNERTGETGFCKVEDVFCTEAYTIYHIWLDGKEELKTTAYHPFFVKDKGWVKSINLRENDILETMEGTACITQIRKVRHEEPVPVYNFHVEDWESYFVSESLVYVHNTDGEHVEESQLAKPGEPLYVGSYSSSRRGNKKTGLNKDYTPHHVVQNAESSVSHGKGITINIPKSLHKETETFCKRRKRASKRDHLAADIKELRKLLTKNGYDRKVVNRQLRELIRQNKALGGFDKPPKK